MEKPLRTFEQTDQFDLHGFSQRLNTFLATEHYFVEGGLVLSLNGSESKDASSVPKSAKLREAAKDVAWFTVGLTGGIASHLSGIDPIAAGEFAETKKRYRKHVSTKEADLLAVYEQRTNSLQHLKKILKETFGGNVPKALLLVDELDRCRPNYAIDYLETIKHVFDIHGLVFVLAVDKSQLRSSAKALFGDLDFEEYYRKFVHRNIQLPFPAEERIRGLADSLSSSILEVTSADFTRSSALKIRDRLEDISQLASELRLTPRQIHELFRLMGHAFACAPEQRERLFWCYGAAAVLLAALSVGRPKLYQRIGGGVATGEDFLSILQLFKEERTRQWWASLILTGYAIDNEKEDAAFRDSIFKSGILPNEMTNPDNTRLAQFAMGWGGARTRPEGLRYTYRVIEEIKGFTTK